MEPMQAELDRIVDGGHHNPHAVLGPHAAQEAIHIRVLRPHAEAVWVVIGDSRHPMAHVHRGIWHCALARHDIPDYRIDTQYDGTIVPGDDPFRFLPTLGDIDLHLIGEGRHEQLWNVLGAHRRSFESSSGTVDGVSFAVWAPNAQGIRVVGDFNFWEGTAHPMRSLGATGIWELFVPHLADGLTYAFDVLGRDGVWRRKVDPVAFATQVPPATGSIVFTSRHVWHDTDWLRNRASTDPVRQPLSIYEVHLGSWRIGLTYRELAEQLTQYVCENGFTHVEFLPVAEHPYAPSWGYQVTSYFAPSARFGNPDDFRFLIDTLHQAGIGVLIDWVPAHFPKDDWALSHFDGTALYEHPDPRRGEHPDWGTYIFNFGRTEVRNFLVSNALYWLEEFHVDGLRVDAVASMLYLDYSRSLGAWMPNQYGGRENLEAVAFLQELNATITKRVPGAVTIAEESTSWPGVTKPTDEGGLGFSLKWNMGWMHDSLTYIGREAIHRQYHHEEMTFAMMYAYSERFVLPLSHDEVVHGKGSLAARIPGDRWQQLATLRTFLATMWAHPGRKLLFMGSEFGQSSEWSSDRGVDWWLLQFDEHAELLHLVADLNRIYRTTPALWQRDFEPEGFEWIDPHAADMNIFTWIRWDDEGSPLIYAANYSPELRTDFRLALPWAGAWQEILNTDARPYGGSGVGNLGVVQADDQPWQGREASALITLPPLGALYLTPLR